MLMTKQNTKMLSNGYFSLHSSIEGKNYQKIPPETLCMFWMLWMIIELAQMKVFALKVQEPGGAAIIFPKSGRNQK